MKKILFLLFSLTWTFSSYGQSAIATKAPTVEQFPHLIASGAGTEGSPYTHADNTAGIQTKVDLLATGRGGKVVLQAARYDMSASAGVVITSESIGIEGVSSGKQANPNGLSEGLNGTKIRFTGNGIELRAPTAPRLNIYVRKLYLYSPTTLQAISSLGSTGTGTKGLYLNGYTEQANFEELKMNNLDFGVYSNTGSSTFFDVVNFRQCLILGGRYGMYFGSSGQGVYMQMTDNVIADNAKHCLYVDGGGGTTNWIIKGNSFVRGCGGASVPDNPSNVYFNGRKSLISNNIFLAAGLDYLASTQRASTDGLIVASDFNTITGNLFQDNAGTTSYALRISGNSNHVSSNIFTGNTNDIIITGNDNIIEADGSTSITDSGLRNIINRTSKNSGDPNSAGNWNAVSKSDGTRIFDTASDKLYEYNSNFLNGRKVIGAWQASSTAATLISQYGFTHSVNYAPTGNSGAGYNALALNLSAATLASTSTNLYAMGGAIFKALHGGSGSLTFGYGVGAQFSVSSGTFSKAVGFYPLAFSTGTSKVIDTYYNFYASNGKVASGTSGTGTGLYGFYTEDFGAGTTIDLTTNTSYTASTYTNKFSFYSEGGNNAFRGTLAIGLAANTAAAAKLEIGAGTSTIAPLGFTSGVDLSSPTAGKFYYNGTRLGFSPSTTIKRVALTNDATPTNGQLNIGNGTDYTIANITAGTNITVTNSSGGITIGTTASPAIGGAFSATGTATTTFTVTIGSTMSNTNYRIGGLGFTSVLASAPYIINNKTTTTFDVVYATAITGSVTFDWVIVP